MKKRRKLPVKYTVALVLIAVFTALWLFDFAWAKTYIIEAKAADYSPVADPSKRVEIEIQVTHFGKPVAGHEIFVLPSAGTMAANLAKTDENGRAILVYIPYRADKFTPLEDVVVTIRDQSNSFVWEINARTDVVLNMRREQ